MKDCVVMAVTADEYETPLATADTYENLGKIVGMDGSGVFRMMLSGNVAQKTFNGEKFRVIKVEVGVEDDID